MGSSLPTLENTLRELVGIDTTSSRSNLPLVERIEPWLRAAGFDVQRQAYKDDSGADKVNVIATKGPKQERAELALVAHTDCVPFDPKWDEALNLTLRDGKLYGRGSCDTKAYLACALHAGATVNASELKKPLMLVFTADEEVGCVGAKKLVDAGFGRSRFAIVGEPTSLTPIRAGKGYCLAEVEITGKEGHSAYPDSGASAIFAASRFLSRLEAWAKSSLPSDADVHFEPPHTTVNVGMVSGGKAKNVIAGACRFVVEWRPIPSQPVEHIPQKLEALGAELTKEDARLGVKVNVLRADRGFDTEAGGELVKFLQSESGKAPETVAFGTEAPQLTALGAQAVVFGPGDIRVAHQTGEHVPVDELHRCQEVLSRAIAHFCCR